MLAKTEPSITSSKAEFVLVEPKDLRKNTHGRMLVPAMRRTDQATVGYVLHMVAEGLWQMLEVRLDGQMVAVVVVHPIEFPRKVSLCIYAIAGRQLDRWLDDGLQYLTEIAEELGFDDLVCYCRPGLVRKLAARGFRETATVMELRI